MTTPPREYTIKKKQQRVNELAQLLDMASATVLAKEKRQEIDNWKAKMDFRFQELVEECKERELDIKIEVMGEILNIFKTK